MTTDFVDVKAALTEGLTELHLPTVKRIYEEAARLAERETLSYERYLLDLITRETQDRRQKRIQRLLRQSRIPAEKALANFNLKRLPPKVALLTKSLIEGEVLDRRDNVWPWKSRQRQDASALCHRAGVDCPRAAHVLHNLSAVSAGSTGCQTGSQAEPLH